MPLNPKAVTIDGTTEDLCELITKYLGIPLDDEGCIPLDRHEDWVKCQHIESLIHEAWSRGFRNGYRHAKTRATIDEL